MKSIEELQADLKQLYAELEERKIMEQESVPKTINFEEISSRAERCQIESHPMNGKDEHEQSMYLLLLLSVVALDDTAYETSFSLLYRISHGMNFKGDVQELFLRAQQMNFERIDEVTRLFINEDIRLVMLMECMMIAQSFKKEYKKAMEYIAELCILMKLEKEQIIMISNIARVILMQDVNEYHCTVRNHYSKFNCYLYPFEKSGNLEITLVRKDCSRYTTHETRTAILHNGKTHSNNFDELELTFSNKRGEIFQYSYPQNIYFEVSVFSTEPRTNRSGERTIDLFEVQSGHECVYFKKKIKEKEEPYTNILVAVTTNAPNFAYALAMKRYNEA